MSKGRFEKYFDSGGDVARKLDEYRKSLILTILFLCTIPLIVYIILAIFGSVTTSYTIFIIIWYIWAGYSYYWLIHMEKEISVVLSMIIILPISIPSTIVILFTIHFLRKRYSNSDNYDERLKFERRRKIKEIL